MKSWPQSIPFRIAALPLTPTPIREAKACLISLWRRLMPKANISPVRALLHHQWMPKRSTGNCASPPRLLNLAERRKAGMPQLTLVDCSSNACVLRRVVRYSFCGAFGKGGADGRADFSGLSSLGRDLSARRRVGVLRGVGES